jgi:hypothetical protein
VGSLGRQVGQCKKRGKKLSNHTFEIIKLCVYAGLGVFAGIIILVLIRAKVSGKFKFGKDGVSFETVETKSRTNHYYMTRRIQDLDVELKTRCRRITNDLRGKVITGLSDIEGICPIVRIALASSLRVPLYHSIEENGFKKKFTKAAMQGYLDILVEEIKLDYQEFFYLIKNACQQDRRAIPEFETIQNTITGLLKTFWAKKIIGQMIVICEKKIASYNDYEPLFRELGDAYMLGVIEECKEKNKKHIEELK